jgi:hypothetical protein
MPRPTMLESSNVATARLSMSCQPKSSPRTIQETSGACWLLLALQHFSQVLADFYSAVVANESLFPESVHEELIRPPVKSRDGPRWRSISTESYCAMGVPPTLPGYIENVRTPSGEIVRVDNEGTVQSENSQTSRTVMRTRVGAAIGAIAGGGKGAAIGAAVGAGAGVGSAFVQGREDLELMSGTDFGLRASAPL